jgi:hypothetical protein
MSTKRHSWASRAPVPNAKNVGPLKNKELDLTPGRRMGWLVTWLCLGVAGRGRAAEPIQAGKDTAQTTWIELIRRSAAEYKIFSGTENKGPLSLQMKPVLRWANNTRASEDGCTFLWIAQGRPEAVTCIYAWGRDAIRHNFGSLSRGPLLAERNGKRVWYPSKPGVEFRALRDTPAPTRSATERLRQMKELAARFTAVLGPGFWNRSEEQLRLLPRELYRYESPGPDLIDGALFAFVQGTDPEAHLLFEAVRTEGHLEWQYALARRTDGSLEVRYRNQVIWRVPEIRAAVNRPEDTVIEFELPFRRSLR